jgi:ABC-2 type transport system permease protein
VEESGALWLVQIARANPFTYVVELIRFALQGQFHATAFGVVLLGGLLCFGLALRGYDPQRGWTRQRG